MSAVAFAAASALCFGLSYVVASRALREASVLAGVLISMVCTWLVTTAAVVGRVPGSVTAEPVVLFVAAGLFSPGLSRVVDMTAVQRLGAASSVPLQAGMRPLLSLLAGLVLLGEAGGLLRILGVGLISVGLVGALRAGPSLSATTATVGQPARSRRALLLPVGTAACFVASDLSKKVGLAMLEEPVFAAWVAVTGSLAGWLVVAVASSPGWRRLRAGRWWPLFCVSGALTGTAQLALFQALRFGDVAVVGPISSLSPLVVLLVSRFLLRGIEVVGWLRLVFLVAIVAGAGTLGATA